MVQRLDGIHAESALEFREASPEERVLHRRQDPVPDELVDRHPAAKGTERRHHPAAEHGVDFTLAEVRNEPRNLLLSVLPVAVEHGDQIEALADRVAVPHFLVAAVPLVVLVAEHSHGNFPVLDLKFAADLESAIAGRIVDDEYF